MRRNQSWLGDAYQASQMRPPVSLGGSSLGGSSPATSAGLPPPMQIGGGGPTGAPAPTTTPMISPGSAVIPGLGGIPHGTAPLGGGSPVGAPAAAAPGAKSGMLQSFMAALQHAHTQDANGDGIPDSQVSKNPAGLSPNPTSTSPLTATTGTSQSAQTAVSSRHRTSLPPPNQYPPPAAATPPPPPQASYTPPEPPPNTNGYVGPGPINNGSGYWDNPERAVQGIRDDAAANPAGWTDWGLFNTTRPGAAALGQLQYLLSDPYNRYITDSSERQSMDATNTAYDAASGKQRSQALQAGAGESGVAQGMSAAMNLAKGNAQAKNVRAFEQYKTDTGDKRLQNMGLPLLGQYNAAKGNPSPSQNSGTDWASTLLPIALALIAA